MPVCAHWHERERAKVLMNDQSLAGIRTKQCRSWNSSVLYTGHPNELNHWTHTFPSTCNPMWSLYSVVIISSVSMFNSVYSWAFFWPWDVFASGSCDAAEGCFFLMRLTWVIKRLYKMYRRYKEIIIQTHAKIVSRPKCVRSHCGTFFPDWCCDQ